MNGETNGVSFVVTVFNKERYLEATLKSVLAQEGDFQKEFIVVDDGSDDRSVEIARDLVGSLPNGKVIEQPTAAPAWPRTPASIPPHLGGYQIHRR